MKKTGFYRALQVFVILGLPLLGFLYAYQFVGVDRGERLIPFKTFQAPSVRVSLPGKANELVSLPRRSKVTVVNFWATWCPPCVEEFPAMMELQRQLEEKGVELIFVSVDDKWENVEKFLVDNGIVLAPGRLYWDSRKEVAQAWGSVRFPETFVLRPDGWVVEKIIGAQQWTRPAVIEYFTKLAAKFDKIPTVTRLGNWDLFPRAFAETSAPQRIHEDDQKALDKLRQNIETASKNLRMSEAALKEEERNLQEQKVILEQKSSLESEAGEELNRLNAKMAEIDRILKKNRDQKKTETNEKTKIEKKIASIQSTITVLEGRLKEERDALVSANQELGTRNQSIETLGEAEHSSESEIQDLQGRVKAATQELNKRKQATQENRAILKEREKKLAEVKRQAETLGSVLEKQKKTLEDFERILKK